MKIIIFFLQAIPPIKNIEIFSIFIIINMFQILPVCVKLMLNIKVKLIFIFNLKSKQFLSSLNRKGFQFSQFHVRYSRYFLLRRITFLFSITMSPLGANIKRLTLRETCELKSIESRVTNFIL